MKETPSYPASGAIINMLAKQTNRHEDRSWTLAKGQQTLYRSQEAKKPSPAIMESCRKCPADGMHAEG